MLNLTLSLTVHDIIPLRLDPVTLLLPVLAHKDYRALDCSHARKNEIEENIGVWIPMPNKTHNIENAPQKHESKN